MKGIRKRKTAEGCEGVFKGLTEKCLLEPDFTVGLHELCIQQVPWQKESRKNATRSF